MSVNTMTASGHRVRWAGAVLPEAWITDSDTGRAKIPRQRARLGAWQLALDIIGLVSVGIPSG